MFGPLSLILLGAVVIVVAAVLVFDRATSGQHVWLPGNQWEIPTGDAMHATRHAWRPGAGPDTIRVKDLVERIVAQYGRHALIDYPPAVDEDQGDDAEGQAADGHRHTHGRPLLRIAS